MACREFAAVAEQMSMAAATKKMLASRRRL